MEVNSIIIVGGGSAGWMTAATLIKLFPEKKITLIESPNAPVVGVGESTLAAFADWLRLLDIKDEDFMKDCDASYKLSIKFTDFYRMNDGGFHYPFGLPDESNLVAGKNTWYFKHWENKLSHVSDYAKFLYPGMALVDANTYGDNEGDLGNFNLEYQHAYHFDAVKFGQTLKNNICIPAGVKYIQDDIKDVTKDERGNIIALNKDYEADLYIDCTGFKSLLLEKMMKVKFNSYNDLLPNDTALAFQIPYKDNRNPNNKEQRLVSYTNCTALPNGWSWRIPSWSRIGSGYVYSSEYADENQAYNEYKHHMISRYEFDITDVPYKKIHMKVGLHDEIFHKNVVAIGLSAGFIEPLESNGLFTVHQFLIYLASLLENKYINQFDKDGFNLKCKTEFDRFAEFVSLHYYLSQRSDSKYWRDLNNKSIKHLKLLADSDIDNHLKLKVYNEYQSAPGGMHCIGTGLHQFPIDKTQIKVRNSITDIKKFTEDKLSESIEVRDLTREVWKEVAKKRPKLIDVLKKIHE